jgi:hypothetical protein
MKIKQLFLSVAIMLTVGLTTNAQTKNVDLDNFRCPVTYRLIPTKPLNPLFFTYSVQVNASKSTENRVSLSNLEDGIYIEGQQKVNKDESPFLSIVVNLGNLIVTESNIRENKEEKKDKEGKITTTYSYHVEVKYNFESSYKFFQGDNVLTTSHSFKSSTIHNYISKIFKNRKEAVDFWNNNKDVLIPQFTSELSAKTVNEASYHATRWYGFYITKETEVIQITDTKKHTENEAFKAICASVKENFGTMTPNERLKKEDMEEAIEYFKSIPDRYTDIKLKSDIKLRYAAYYNLCKIYLYLEDLENVHHYADLLIQNGHDKKDGEKLKKSADELKEMLSRTEIKTRHFNPEDHFGENQE